MRLFTGVRAEQIPPDTPNREPMIESWRMP